MNLQDLKIKEPAELLKEAEKLGIENPSALRKQVLPYTFGRSALKRFNKADVNIVERLVNKMMHFGKKYAKNTGRMAGKKFHTFNVVKTALPLKASKVGVDANATALQDQSKPPSNHAFVLLGPALAHIDNTLII
mgnify:CR=1 FL=1